MHESLNRCAIEGYLKLPVWFVLPMKSVGHQNVYSRSTRLVGANLGASHQWECVSLCIGAHLCKHLTEQNHDQLFDAFLKVPVPCSGQCLH